MMIPSVRFIPVAFILVLFFLPGKSQIIPEENRQCLECHTSQTISLHNEWTDMEEKRLMNPFYILDTVKIAKGVHGAFQCIDCHSYEYETYPHNGELKLEPLMTCIDCHGGDDTYASYQFDLIEEEFQKSVHFETHGEQFSCSKCHSQHYYRATARTSSDVREIVEYSNNMCLSCHDNMTKYQLVSEHENPQLVEIHEWLPNQALHFRHVRCIECHTEVLDSLMVSHNILRKEHATKNCVECHSTNSMLQASLYKYQNLKSRTGEKGESSGGLRTLPLGGINSDLSNEYYLIGASNIPFLNTLFAIIFFAMIGGIVTHAIFRILTK